MRHSRFPMKRQPSIPVGDVAARNIVTDTRIAGSEQRGSEASRLLLVLSGTDDSSGAGFRNAWASSTRGANAGDAVQIAQQRQRSSRCRL